jgi:histidinol-phosphate/aromatic aminotransferase/cobyric acid decarboxylase-like protein
MRMQRLEKPEPWPHDLAQLLTVPESALRLYPNLPPLYEKAADFFGVHPDHVVFGAGIEDFLRGLMWLCCDPGDKAAVTWPTCAMFDVLADMFKVDLVRIKHGPRERPTVHEFLEKLPVDLKLLFLPNPGQPVEICFDREELCVIANWCHANDTLLAIDEAYWGFGADTAISLTKSYDNLVVLRSFSKLFGSAGARLGCAIGSHKAIKPLEALRLSSEITGASAHTAMVMLDHFHTHVYPWSLEVVRGRTWLRERLKDDGFFVRGRWANHVLVEFPDYCGMVQMADHLNELGIYVKSRFPEPLENCLLITCGSQDYMERFYQMWQMLGEAAADRSKPHRVWAR